MSLEWQPHLYRECTHDWKMMFTLLIHKEANVLARDAKGNTLIDRSTQLPFKIEGMCLQTTEILVEAGCSPPMPDSGRELPTQIPVRRALASALKYLLSCSTSSLPMLYSRHYVLDVNLRRTLRMVSSLVEGRAYACVLATNGDTTLHDALTHRRVRWPSNRRYLLQVVEILVRADCDMRGRDTERSYTYQDCKDHRIICLPPKP